MLGIDRYILRQLSVAMVFVTIGLSAILWLTQSLRFVELTVNKGASIAVFLKLTLLVLPNFLAVILPVSLFSVVLFTYNKLINDREISVLKGAGLSHMGLARPALFLAAICAVIGLVLNIWVIPKTVDSFRQMQWQLRNNVSGVILHEGMFNQVAKGITVYVRARNPDGELLGIIVHDRRSSLRTVTLMAERGALIQSEDGESPPKVLLFNGTRQQITKGSDRLSLLSFDNYAMEFSDSPEPDATRRRDVRERSLRELFSATEAEVGAVDFRQFRVEGHQRLASPLYHFAFALIATACLLAGGFNRRGQGDRLILAIGLMLAVQAAALGVSNLSARSLIFLPLVYITPIVPALAAILVLLAPSWKRPAASVRPG